MEAGLGGHVRSCSQTSGCERGTRASWKRLSLELKNNGPNRAEGSDLPGGAGKQQSRDQTQPVGPEPLGWPLVCPSFLPLDKVRGTRPEPGCRFCPRVLAVLQGG